MDDIKNIFIEEANELVSSLESLLITLEEEGVSSEIIGGIFRVMHSLKGGSSMFGFSKLDELTHQLETVYNFVRNQEEALNQEIIDITFKSVDIIKDLLSNKVEDEAYKNTDELIVQIKKVIDKQENTVQNQTKEASIENNILKTYYILFKPHEDIMNNGTNPLFIIDELVELGEEKYVIARTNDIPDVESYKPEICYVWWEVILVTHTNIEDIKSVFMFVEDDAEIKVEEIYNDNIFNFSGFNGLIEKISSENLSINFDELLKNLQNASSNTNNVAKELQAEKNLVRKAKDLKSIKVPSEVKNNAISSIRVSSLKLDELMNMVSELVTTQARLNLFAETNQNQELTAISEDITKITRRLRDNAFSIILIPIESILTKFRRLVRDLSINLDKEIRFITEGTDTELDKTIIETINEPLLHIIRNSIDHGIESKEERIKLGKPEQGTIKLKSFHSGSNVHIQISDDGSGLNLDSIKKKAIENGLISQDAILSEKDIVDLIWMPGFSTAKEVTDVSGRGVGMDIVRKKISNVRGDIEINTKKDTGTTFTLKLPLTLSIIDGLLVSVDNTRYIIQLSVIDKIHKIKHFDLNESHNDVIVIDGKQIPYVNLRDYYSKSEIEGENEHIVVIEYEDKKVAIVVDEVLGEYQAVLKPLGKHYKEIEIFSGGTILGDGSIALVLDTNKIVREHTKKIRNI